MYSALVTKTNRIARILAGSKKRIITKKPRFMSATAQVIITWLLISIEVGIIITLLIHEPADKMLKYPFLDRVVLTCNTKVLGKCPRPIAPYSCLLNSSTLLPHQRTISWQWLIGQIVLTQ